MERLIFQTEQSRILMQPLLLFVKEVRQVI